MLAIGFSLIFLLGLALFLGFLGDSLLPKHCILPMRLPTHLREQLERAKPRGSRSGMVKLPVEEPVDGTMAEQDVLSTVDENEEEEEEELATRAHAGLGGGSLSLDDDHDEGSTLGKGRFLTKGIVGKGSVAANAKGASTADSLDEGDAFEAYPRPQPSCGAASVPTIRGPPSSQRPPLVGATADAMDEDTLDGLAAPASTSPTTKNGGVEDVEPSAPVRGISLGDFD